MPKAPLCLANCTLFVGALNTSGIDSCLANGGGNIEVYPEPLRRKIIICGRPECNLRLKYPSDWRERNLGLLNMYAPEEGIKTVIISESPPSNGTYIYDPCSECYPSKFSYHVFSDLGFIGSSIATIDKSKKEDLLLRMKRDGVIVMDCCHCAVNHLKGYSRMRERDGRVVACFNAHTQKALASIRDEYDLEMWFKFPSGRGNELFKALKIKYGSRIKRIPY